MADEGLREIQLNGKQLVFLFMAATVVAVVIFLCGVMVGRGVRQVRANELAVAAADPSVDPTSSSTTASRANASSQAGSEANPSPAQDATYPVRLGLEGQDPPEETIEEVLKPARAVTPPAVQARRSAAPASAQTGVPGEPAGKGFVVQVAALNDRRQADAIAGRLSRKGYPSFVTTAGAGPSRMFRVRVGKYPERSDAQSIAARLEKEEQFKPWITR